jgi:hypothetical protein
MSGELARVKRAAERKSKAEQEYLAALRAAYDAGEEYADIGRAAGISRQAARQILNPQLRKS